MRQLPDNSAVLVAFIARTEIDTILARIAALSAEHFNRAPDDVTWADVGTLTGYVKGLREVSDAAFDEGEHAAKLLTFPLAPTGLRPSGLGLVVAPDDRARFQEFHDD